MSHIRNLFHRPFGHHPPPASAVAAAASTVAMAEELFPSAVIKSGTAAGGSSATIATLPDFPVEEAKLYPVSRLVFHGDPLSSGADRFRFLRTRLRERGTAGKLKKLLITSPLAHDGKSTIVMNLATALLERGKRSVLVIEADLHHASVAERLQLHSWPGLTECLQDRSISPLSQIRRVEPLGWHLLPAGEPGRNPTELVQSRAFGAIIQELSSYFDWVLFDSPPAIPLTDAIVIQQHADASLLVVRAGQTPRAAVEQTVALLGKSKVVGIVLNGVERRNQPSYHQGYYRGTRFHED